MEKENNKLIMESDDFWSVKDLSIFLSSLNCLYNRLFVLKKYSDGKLHNRYNRQGKLYHRFLYSTLLISNEEQIKIDSLKIGSPGLFNFIGIPIYQR